MTTPVHRQRQEARAPRPRGFRGWARLIIGVAMSGPLLLGLLALSGIGHRWLDILFQFTAPVLLLTAIVTAVLAPVRLWTAASIGLAATVILACAVAPQWFPASPAPRVGAPEVRLYSANLWALNTDVEAITASVAAADADVVVLVELGDAPAARIDQVLAGYPHRIATPRVNRSSGAARSVIASRWPLTVIRDRPDGLHAVGATVRTPLGPLNVMGVHLTRPWPFQEQWGQISQTMALGAVIRDLSGPVVVAGDFNSVSGARIGRQIRHELGLHPASGFPGTWPTAAPPAFAVTIDQVYRSPDLTFVSRRLGLPTGSDHRPVVTEVTLAAD